MVTKMTVKNQITVPKKIIERMGLVDLKEEDRYFEIQIKDDCIVLKPVTLIVEERIPEEKWHKFETWATKIEKDDVVFGSSKKASQFLKKRIKKS